MVDKFTGANLGKTLRYRLCERDKRYNIQRESLGMRLMRKDDLDEIRIDVICGDCGTGQCRPIKYFRKHSNLVCEDCGAEILLDNKRFQASIAEFGRTMVRLRRSYVH